MAMNCVGRTARSEGPPLASHATPHGEVAKGSPPPKLLEHPTVAGPELERRLETPTFTLNQPRPAFARSPAKASALLKARVPFPVGDPAHDNYSSCCSPVSRPPITQPPALAG